MKDIFESQAFNAEERCKFSGITTEEIHSLGTIDLELTLANEILSHSFHIVNSEFPIYTDGIIGRDFFKKYLCKIDYETFTISLVINDKTVTLPMHSKPHTSLHINIPPRTEIIKAIKLNLTEDSVIFNNEIKPGIFLSNSIAPKNGMTHLKILNTTTEEITLQGIQLQTDSLKNYDILGYNKTNDSKRFEQIINELNIDSNDDHAKTDLINIFRKYQNVFHLENEKLTINNFYKQKILTSDNTPVYIKNYRLPHSHTDIINDQVQNLLNDDIIEPSVSPYNAPLLLVPKKGTEDKKKWRLVVDFRKLNDKIVNDKFPLTRLEDILDKLGRAKWFSTLDMTSSFHQIGLDKGSRPLTAFSTPQGHYHFKRLPFGLKISSNSFQRMLTIALSGLDSEAFLYVDDIIVFGCSLKHHNQSLIKVLDRLQKYNLKLNPKKCCFLKPEVVYLGHLITKDGVRTDPSKYDVIKNYPIPKNQDEVRRFVAFCNYYRKFIPNFADIAKDLNALLKKTAKFIWTEQCQNAFDELKERLMKPPVLQYPNFEKPFILTTDASNYALGAVLSQGEIGQDLPISYASKSLQKHDMNKPVIEKELLAIHWSINFFRPYLYGRKFIVVTDHRPLIALFSHKNPSSKMTRIRLDLSDYDFSIVYKKGKMNTNADALSRIEINSDILKQMIPLENDDKERKLLITTRAMTRNNNKNNEASLENNKEANIEKENINNNNNVATSIEEDSMEKCISQKPDQLHIWECTSINDVKNIRKLKFNNIETLERIDRIDIYIEDNIVHVGRDENSSKPVSTMKKSRTKKINKNIENNNENINMHARFSDKSAKLDSILRKLISTMKKENIKELALANDDKIFKVYTKEEIKKIYERIIINNKSPQVKILIYKAPKRISDDILKYKLIDEYHNTTHAGHLGIRKTIIKLKQRYIWKNMNKMVKKFVSYCDSCNINKQTKHIKEPLTLTNTPSNSFEVISIDTVGPLRISNDYRYILTMQCELTKFVIAHPMPTKDALTTARTLVEQFILKYGQFKVLKSDRGTEFINELMNNICSLLKIKQVFSTPYHHETLGSIERNHRVLNEFLLTTANDYEWDKWIPYFTFAYNTAPHIDTGYTPFELIYGKLPCLPSDIKETGTKIYNYDDYVKELQVRLQFALNRTKELITNSKNKRTLKSNSNRNNTFNLEIGDLVLVKVGNRKKNQSPYKGPYKIINRNGVNTTIDFNGIEKTYHNNNLKPYKTL